MINLTQHDQKAIKVMAKALSRHRAELKKWKPKANKKRRIPAWQPTFENFLLLRPERGLIAHLGTLTACLHHEALNNLHPALLHADRTASFTSLVRRFNLNISGDQANFNGGGYAMTMGWKPNIDEFPEDRLQNLDGYVKIGHIHRQDRDNILRAFKYVSRDDLREVLTCVYIDNLHVVGTDANRLFFTPVQDAAPEGLIIPKKARQFLHLSDSWEIWQHQHTPDMGRTLMKSVDGWFSMGFETPGIRYPDYSAVIPRTFTTTITYPKRDMIEAVQAAWPFTQPGTREVRLNIQAGSVVISAEADAGTFGMAITSRTDMICVGGLKIAFNARYLLDVLAECEGPMITMEMTEPNKAAVLNSEFLLMPLNITQQ
jgi:hypothetical protein